MPRLYANCALLLPLAVIVFALFPLTDTDIWWHLACAREWVVTWTPVRTPVVNVHEYFQQVVYFIYSLGGPSLLAVSKAILWGLVFALFLLPYLKKCRSAMVPVTFSIVVAFLFRFHFEIRPVLFSLLFLGIYWNVLPALYDRLQNRIINWKTMAGILSVFLLQWLWCRFQGLYILGPVFAAMVLGSKIPNSRKNLKSSLAFTAVLFLAPFFHSDGLSLFLYPFGLLDRLLGLTPSAALFASEIAENRSPFTLLLSGENVLTSSLAILLSLGSLLYCFRRISKRIFQWHSLRRISKRIFQWHAFQRMSQSHPLAPKESLESAHLPWLFITAVLALIAERNVVLFLPVLISFVCSQQKQVRFAVPCLFIIFLLLGFWTKGFLFYDSTWVSYQRVPVAAAQWMLEHHHKGRLFNDDRAGGYLAFVNPADSTYIDGRFILKTSDFFERYLEYAKNPDRFFHDADSLGIDRAIFPLEYYARWDILLMSLGESEKWQLAYVDKFYAVFDRKNLP